MKRIFHRHEKWEEVDFNFFSSVAQSKLPHFAELVLSVLANEKECEKWMLQVLIDWPLSCEHNLSNQSLNRVAWLGQASCALAHKVPQDATMKIWSMLSVEEKSNANNIAKSVIKKWDEENEN